MSPRRADQAVKIALMDAAARILTEQGPGALTTRRLAGLVGTSTMAVYTHFGAMEELVREMVREGFARLDTQLSRVNTTGDPVSDIATLGRAYRFNAVANQHLYVVMLGGSSLGGFSLSEKDRQYGRYTLAALVTSIRRAIAAGRLRDQDPELLANQFWAVMHGLVTLELGGFLIAPYDPDTCFEAQLRDLMVGAGDDLATATRSVNRSRERAALEVRAPAEATG